MTWSGPRRPLRLRHDRTDVWLAHCSEARPGGGVGGWTAAPVGLWRFQGFEVGHQGGRYHRGGRRWLDDVSRGTSKTTAPGDAATGDDEPIKVTGNSVKDFCDTLAKVANQSEGAQDYKPLQESAPDEIKPVVDDLAKAAEEAQTADAPSADLQERGTRAVVGVTVFALNECGDTAGLAEAIGIDDAAAKMLSKYTVDDVQDDATWEKIKAELQQG